MQVNTPLRRRSHKLQNLILSICLSEVAFQLENLNVSFLGFNFQEESGFVNFKRHFHPKNKQNNQKGNVDDVNISQTKQLQQYVS